jgi:hypothetical protein
MNFNLLFENEILKYKKMMINELMNEFKFYKKRIQQINRNRCNDCKKVLSSRLNYQHHIKNNVCTKIIEYKCGHCSKSFTRKHNYRIHIINNICGNNNDDNIKIINKINNKKQEEQQDKNKEIKKKLKKNKLKENQNVLNKIYLEEYRKIIREKIYDNLKNIDIEKNNIPFEILKDTTHIRPKYKKVKISNIFKRQCWNHWIGEDIGKIICPVCKLTYITQLNFSCAHIISESKGGKLELNNVRPICCGCNSSVYTNDLTSFIQN